jgi:hypothetical protein
VGISNLRSEISEGELGSEVGVELAVWVRVSGEVGFPWAEEEFEPRRTRRGTEEEREISYLRFEISEGELGSGAESAVGRVTRSSEFEEGFGGVGRSS